MRIKAGSVWRDPKQVAVKTNAVWKEASEVHHKQGNGEWLKVLDFSSVLSFKVRCDFEVNPHPVHPCIYETFWEGNYLIQTGDYLEYEILSSPETDMIKIELGLMSPNGTVTYLGGVYEPANGWAFSRLDQGTLGRWISQKVPLAYAVNYRLIDACIAIESDTVGNKEVYVRNVVITNAGQRKLNLFTTSLVVPQYKVWQPQWGTLRNYAYVSKGVMTSYNP